MKKYLPQYVSEFEDKLNIPLMLKSADIPLVEYIKDAWKSLEIVDSIKILGFDYTEKESDIDINNFIYKREKKKKKKDIYNYKFVQDNRYGCLTTTIQITVKEQDKGKDIVIRRKTIAKKMLIPIQDEDGYFFIKGKKYYLLYQMVDKSSYTSSSSVTLKSLMPIAVKRNAIKTSEFNRSTEKAIDTNHVEYNLPIYNVFVFRKEIPIILFYAANGMDWALSYLGVENILGFKETMEHANYRENIYFQISSKCFIEVNREMFLKYPYIQSIVGGLLHICTNRITVQDLNNKNIWIKKLSSNNTLEKGNDILIFLLRLLDRTTQKILMVSDHDKEDIYAILRWMMMNFNELRLKDNMSLNNKRLRCNEYIAALLTQEFSTRLNSVITLGNKATMQDYLDMFKFSGEILLRKIYDSGVLRFNDTMNDLDFFSRFKYTTKGPNSLGRKNSNNISVRYRSLHPSYLGYIDILVCGNTDPGTSGVLSPFNKIEGLYFDNSKEPDSYMYEFHKDMEKIMNDKDTLYMEIHADDKDSYYRMLDKIMEFNRGCFKISGVSKEKYDIIVENDTTEESDEDDETEPL